MQRHGGVKQEILFVLLFIVFLGGLAVVLTMRQGATEDESFVRPELLGNQSKPQSSVVSTGPVDPIPNVDDKPNQDIPKEKQTTVTTKSGLKMIDQRIGGGDKVKIGTEVEVFYSGKLLNGQQFDSNVGKRPYRVKVGVSSVIQGWHEGLVGMHNGGKRQLIIPSQLAYGEAGSPPQIPPRADLIFDIEVVKVTNK